MQATHVPQKLEMLQKKQKNTFCPLKGTTSNPVAISRACIQRTMWSELYVVYVISNEPIICVKRFCILFGNGV